MKRLLLLFFMLPLPLWAADASCISCHEKSVHYEEIDCTGCHDGIAGTSREDLAHYKIIKGAYAYHMWESPQAVAGGETVKRYFCRRCHRINAEGSSLASNLDVSVRRLTPEGIAEAIKVPNAQMPDFRFAGQDIEALVNALLRYSRMNTGSSMVEVVHFGAGQDSEVFQTNCGGCHMLLSRQGALGKRPLAPFLSGMNTQYYPLLDNRTWTRQMLSDWIDNPRKLKPFATMPVVELKDGEKEKLLEIIW
jgi:mono/diheme cytochrome c family protein